MKCKLRIISALQWSWQRCAAVMLCMVCSLLFLLSGCGKEDFIILKVNDTPNYSIVPGANTGEVDVKCSLVVKEEGSDTESFIEMTAISNFIYEKGYEFLLKVRKKSDHYSLEEIVSKTLKYEIDPVIIFVTCELAPVGPEGEMIERMIVKEDENSDLFIPSSFKIEGFEYDKGYEYRLKVRKTVITVPPQTGFGLFILYELIEIISKSPKNL